MGALAKQPVEPPAEAEAGHAGTGGPARSISDRRAPRHLSSGGSQNQQFKRPPSASCYEGSVTLDEVSRRTRTGGAAPLQHRFAFVEVRPADRDDTFHAMGGIGDLTGDDEIIGLSVEHQLIAAGGK